MWRDQVASLNAMKDGVSINRVQGGMKYLRIKAGPMRDKYVHILIAEAKLGRKLRPDETVEHRDGNGLNCDPDNLIVVTRSENTRLMHERRSRCRTT
jgi:hypothetical protein